MAEKKNLEIYRGDSKTVTVNFSSNASMLEAGNIWFTLKNKKDDSTCDDPENQCVFQTSDPILPVYNEDNTEITGYKAEIYIPPSDSELFDITSYVYDIQAVGDQDEPGNPGSPAVVKTLVEGKLKVLEDVTIKTA